jgi:hypothetical protein
MDQRNSGQLTGILGMFGACLFFVGLLIEYQYGLFPPGSGTLYMINQIMFYVAMSCILVMLWGLRAAKAGGDGRFARITLTVFPIGWATLVLGGIVGLITGYYDNPLVPLGFLTILLFGLLAGIAVVIGKNWRGWTRFAPLLQGLYYLLVMMILPPILTGSNDPTLLTESLWMATWFLMSLALFVNERQTIKSTLAVSTGNI